MLGYSCWSRRKTTLPGRFRPSVIRLSYIFQMAVLSSSWPPEIYKYRDRDSVVWRPSTFPGKWRVCVCVLRESLYAASSRRDTYNEFLLNFRRAGPFDWVIFHQKAQRIEKTLSAFHFRHSFPYILFVCPRRLPAAAAAALCVYI